ncbi:MAG: 50S ribosomal protein L6 [Bryobacteraceae bacterium]|jgi:large subunit ribosomal protein L6|nr:50S ribosomal protein L6 [Bryobacteraceae bacterium]
MSRVGKKPIPLPAGVKITVGEQLLVEGPKGKLTVPLPQGIRVEKVDSTLEIKRENDSFRALHGLTRALAANAVTGVSTGFTRELDIVGIGYRAETKGSVVSFTLGYSHPIEFALPKGVECKIEKMTHLVLSSNDKQQLGQIAADIRALRPPEPYKQKGIRYVGEVLRKKVGKTGASGK